MHKTIVVGRTTLLCSIAAKAVNSSSSSADTVAIFPRDTRWYESEWRTQDSSDCCGIWYITTGGVRSGHFLLSGALTEYAIFYICPVVPVVVASSVFFLNEKTQRQRSWRSGQMRIRTRRGDTRCQRGKWKYLTGSEKLLPLSWACIHHLLACAQGRRVLDLSPAVWWWRTGKHPVQVATWLHVQHRESVRPRALTQGFDCDGKPECLMRTNAGTCKFLK